MNTVIKISREDIIWSLKDYFFGISFIWACWLGWSDANNESDDFSDIDMYFSVWDENIESFFPEVVDRLTKLWRLDYISEIITEGNQTGQLYHIAGTSDNLLIEIWCIPQSHGMMFEEWHPAFKPKILFDKENIIQFKPFQEAELQKQTERLLIKQKDLVAWYGRRDVYIRRNNYIEATNYYIKFTFMPLVEVLRIKYTPRLLGWWRIHISRHFPQDIVVQLEQLMQFQSVQDIEKNMKIAQEWFWNVVEEIEAK